MRTSASVLVLSVFAFLAACTSDHGIKPAPSAVEPVTEGNPARPNVVVILFDDLGYSDIGAFGSEIRTPNMDSLADVGIAFTQFYVYPRCSPTRAALLTGAYPHQSGLAFLTTPEGVNVPTGPYQGYLDPSIPTLANRFSELGYRIYMSGKWHLGEAPSHWPLNYGFERYFGLISGASSYFELLDEGARTRRMALDDAPFVPPAEGFYMTDATTSYALEFLSDHETSSSDRPFFLYLSYTAPHWPLHAPEAEIDAYNGVYDGGWDAVALARRERQASLGLEGMATALPVLPEQAGDWPTYGDKEGWARRMQVHAAMVSIADRGVGEVIGHLRRTGKLESTLILIMSDNGASSEDIEGRGLNDPTVPVGRRGSYVAFGQNGAAVANTPLRDYKGSTFEGGVRSPLIIHWPDGIRIPGQLDRDSVLNVLDIAPSVLALAGDPEAAAKMRLEGQAIPATLTGDTRTDSGPFYWEHLGWRGVRYGNWKAVSFPNSEAWQLFDIASDPTESIDISTDHPEQVRRMSSNWADWAARVGATPLSREELMRLFAPPGSAPPASGPTR